MWGYWKSTVFSVFSVSSIVLLLIEPDFTPRHISKPKKPKKPERPALSGHRTTTNREGDQASLGVGVQSLGMCLLGLGLLDAFTGRVGWPRNQLPQAARGDLLIARRSSASW